MAKIGVMGVCGIGMSAIAEFYLQDQNNQVFGCDSNFNGKRAQELIDKGILVVSEEDFLQNDGADFIVKSSAIRENNPALLRAKAAGITVLSRKEALSQITKKYAKVLAVTGTHGKTTTTTLLAEFFTNLGFNPTVFCGGIMAFCQNNLLLGGQEFLILEADESDGTFLEIQRNIGLVTNINWDHPDFYPSFESNRQAFELFVASCDKFLLPYSDAQKIPNFKPFLTFGLEANNTISARNISRIKDGLYFDLHFDGQNYPCRINTLGEHNIVNALGVLGVALTLGFTREDLIPIFQKTLTNFQGVARRFNLVPADKRRHLRVLDDYAHHPREVKVTIGAVKNTNNLIVVWQPHRFTRVAAFWEEFLEAFYKADLVLVSDIFAGGETPIPEFSGDFLVKKLLERGVKAFYTPDVTAVTEKLDQIASTGDEILFLGAGSSSDWAKNFA